jgi:hypothetical protein
MDNKERELLTEEAGEDIEPRLSLRSQTKVDTGGWFGSTPLWLAVSEDEIFVLANGKRPYFERVSLQDCNETHYNPATGEIIIAPTEGLICNQLAFSPSEAMELLQTLGIEESQWTHKVTQEDIIPETTTRPTTSTSKETPKTSRFAKFKAQRNQ